jgi:aminoglycoside phosphotransferase (APT) family kinase protein
VHKAALGVIAERLYPGSKLQRAVRLTGGVSANVFRLDLQGSDGGSTKLVLREHGAAHSGHPAELEFRLLQALAQTSLPVPKPLHLDIGCTDLPHPYLLMGFVEGSSDVFKGNSNRYLSAMADLLADIHDTPIEGLPALPKRCDPLPELFDLLPRDSERNELSKILNNQEDTAYAGKLRLLHGDFWPENILWQNDSVAAIVDWEDAAIGDPLSDVACCQLELRYKLGPASMNRFRRAYEKWHPVDLKRLCLWQLYVASAAFTFMGKWGLPAKRESHMRAEALATIREAITALTTDETSG